MADFRPQLQSNRPWLEGEVRQGREFCDRVDGITGKLLDRATDWNREAAESKAATAELNEALRSGAGLARRLRRAGDLAAEGIVEEGGEDANALASKLRVASGNGVRADLRRQSGVRRLLLAQQEGLDKVSDVVAEWPRLKQLHEGVPGAIARIDQALAQRTREQLEADMASDALQEEQALAVDKVNQVIRIVRIAEDDAPQELRAALLMLQGKHPRLFPTRETPEEEAEPVEPPAEPAEA